MPIIEMTRVFPVDEIVCREKIFRKTDWDYNTLIPIGKMADTWYIKFNVKPNGQLSIAQKNRFVSKAYYYEQIGVVINGVKRYWE